MKLFFGVLMALPVFGLAQKPEGFTIEGKVTGAAENSAVYITDASNPTDTVATGVIKGGQFVLKGHVSEANLYEVNFASSKKKAPVFLGNDKMSLTGDVTNVAQIKTAGSPTNDDFMAFQTTFTPYFTRLNGVIAQFICRKVRQVDGGDHLIFLGEVEEYRYNDGEPLVFHSGRYRVATRHPDITD